MVPEKRSVQEELPIERHVGAVKMGNAKLHQVAVMIAALLAEANTEKEIVIAGACPAGRPLGFGDGWADTLLKAVIGMAVLIIFCAGCAAGRWTAARPEVDAAALVAENLRLRSKIAMLKSTGGFESSKVEVKSIGCQSQCTYKFKYVSPRFVPLADSSHGAFG